MRKWYDKGLDILGAVPSRPSSSGTVSTPPITAPRAEVSAPLPASVNAAAAASSTTTPSLPTPGSATFSSGSALDPSFAQGTSSAVAPVEGAMTEAQAIELFRQSAGQWDPFEFEEMPEMEKGNLIHDVLGLGFDWTDIFNPAAAGFRFWQEQQQPEAVNEGFAAGAKTPGGTYTAKPLTPAAKAAAARLAASKAKLAALQQQIVAQHLAALKQSQTTASAFAPTTPPSDASTQTQDDGSAATSEDVSVMGFPTDELDDIMIDSYEREITDEPPDYERRRASVHRGAAYLQDIDYPPHGASSGQEGGMIMPTNRIEIFGHHYRRGLDILGAKPALMRSTPVMKPAVKTLSGGVKAPVVPQRAGFKQLLTPGGRAHTSLQINTSKKPDQKTSIKNARTVGQRAVSVGNKIKQKLTAATKVHGAPAATKAGVKPVMSRLVATKLSQMVDKVIKKGKQTIAAADKHEKLVGTAQNKLKAGVQKVAARLDPSKKTAIHGCVAEEAEEIFGIMFEDMLGASMPDPNNPGYLLDGSPDPAYYGTGAQPDPNNPGYLTDGTPDPNYGGAAQTDNGVPGPPNYGLGPAPTGAPPLVPGIDFLQDPGAGTDTSFYSSMGDPGTVPLPQGAVIYDGTMPMPEKCVGSYSYFHGNVPGAPPPDFGDGSGFFWGDDQSWHYWGSSFYNVAGVDLRTKRPNAQEAASLPTLAQSSRNHNWGPLVGNPKMPDWANIRYDIGGNQWFWYRDKAPKWATAADDQQRANQAILDYQTQFTAAQTDYTAQKAQDALDAQNAAALAKQQAAEDAATQRQMQQEQAQAQHQADLEAVQAQQQAQQQQLADEAAQRQAQAQSQIDIQQAQAQADIERQDYQAQMQAQLAQMQAAAQMQAMQPPDDSGDAGDAGTSDGGESYDQAAADLDSGAAVDDWGTGGAYSRVDQYQNEEDVMGHIGSGSDRLKRRRF